MGLVTQHDSLAKCRISFQLLQSPVSECTPVSVVFGLLDLNPLLEGADLSPDEEFVKLCLEKFHVLAHGGEWTVLDSHEHCLGPQCYF